MNAHPELGGRNGAPATLLVVDDSPHSLGALSALLEPHYRVLATRSGHRALELAGAEPRPDLILLDVMMPEMDGYAVLVQLRAAPATRDIPVIFLSAMDSMEDEERGLELGAEDYITKPIRAPIVLARVQIHLELKRARDWLKRQASVLEDEVARREDILRTVTTAAQDAVIMIDNQARVAFWNPAAERIFGYRAAAVHGVEFYPLIAPPRYHTACIAAFDEFRRHGTGTTFGNLLEVTAMRSDGSEFPAEVSLAPVRRGNEWWGVGIVRDITERQRVADEGRARLHELTAANAALTTLNERLTQAQNQLLQSEKMAAIGQLAAGVAHELNNPIGFVNSNIATLNGYVHDLLAIIAAFENVPGHSNAASRAHQLMTEKDLPFIRQDIAQLMDESRDGLDRVRRIIQDLMDFSRVGESRWQWADLHAGIDSTLNIVWNELKYNCTVRKEYGELPLVYCIPSQLNQVMMNLLVNAGHAIVDKGEITIRTATTGDEVRIEVCDTGLGIAAENLPRIFEPFFTTKPVGKGTGLGLSLAYSIVQRHRGRIEVDSTPGSGSVFRVILPIGAENDAPVPADT